MSNGAAMGPDGLPVQVYNYGGNFIVKAMTDITLQSIEIRDIPNFRKVGWITSIWKGMDKEVAGY